MAAQCESQDRKLPSDLCLRHATKLSVIDDKPIMLDYWSMYLDKKVIIGVRESGEKLLVKSDDEYTSPITKIYKVDEEFLVVTENSIYVTSCECPTKRISG